MGEDLFSAAPPHLMIVGRWASDGPTRRKMWLYTDTASAIEVSLGAQGATDFAGEYMRTTIVNAAGEWK